MGATSSECCIPHGCFSDNKDQQADQLHKHQKPCSPAVPQTALSDALGERENPIDVLNCQRQVNERAIVAADVCRRMTVVFQKPGGSTQLVTFKKKPVGLNFGPAAHWSREVKKVAPGSHAQEAGVEKGWVILTINGESLPGADDEAIHAKFSTAVSVLSFSKWINRLSSGEECASPLDSTRSPASSVSASPLGLLGSRFVSPFSPRRH